jgi:tetratricopeptide (TPR) repeat protein
MMERIKASQIESALGNFLINSDLRQEYSLCKQNFPALVAQLQPINQNSTDWIQLKNSGNVAFGKKNFSEAAEYYAKSLISISSIFQKDKSDLAVLLGNRATAKFHLRRFQESVDDATIAIECNRKYTKAYIRRGEALSNINQNAAALKDFYLAITLLNPSASIDVELATSSSIDAEWFERNLSCLPAPSQQACISCFESVFPHPTSVLQLDHVNQQLDSTSQSLSCQVTSNYYLPGASENVEMFNDGFRGRSLRLTEKSVDFGTCLVEEDAFAAVLPIVNSNSYCSHCLLPFEISQVIPCSECCTTLYCSQQCRTIAWKQYHRFECQQSMLLRFPTPVRLGMRVFLRSFESVSELVAGSFNRLILERFELISTEGLSQSWSSDSIRNILSLDAHKREISQHEPQLWLEYRMFSLLATWLLSSTIKFDSNDESLCSIVYALILHHVCQTHSNTHAVTAVQSDSSDEVRQLRVGSAIFSTASLMNHSCRPNVSISFRGRKIVVKAGRPLSAGTELKHCYGPSVYQHQCEERQAALSNQYFFRCDCADCSNSLDGASIDSWKCIVTPICNGRMRPDQKLFKCSECRSVLDASQISQIKHTLQRSDSAFQYAEHLLESDSSSLTAVAEALHACLDMRKSILCSLHKDIAEVHDRLGRVYHLMGMYRYSKIS